MKLILSTHNVTLTKAIEDHVESRIEQLEHLDRYAIDARVTLERNNTKTTEKEFKCSMRLAMPGPDSSPKIQNVTLRRHRSGRQKNGTANS